MNAPPQSGTSCPSRYRLDRMIALELAPADIATVQEHLSECERCACIVSDARDEQQRFVELPQALHQRVHERSQGASPPVDHPAGVSLSRWAWAFAMAATVGAVWIGWPSQPHEPMGETVRTKGSATNFYVMHEGEIRPGTDGEHVHPGDSIQFVYASDRDTYLAIVSIDGAGKATAYYDDDGRAAKLARSPRTTLDRSTVLDDTLGEEIIYTLFCPGPLELQPVLRALERAPTQPPRGSGCAVDAYRLIKTAP